MKATFLDWEVAKDSLPDILLGLWLNIRVLAVSAVLIVLVGLGIAALRTLRGPLWFPVRALAAAYTDFFRGMPLIILLYLVGFGLPGLQLRAMPTSPVVLGTIALVLTYSAYVAEVFRAGIESVHPSQRAAARSLGLSYGQTMRRVVLPQAVRRVTPPLLNDFVALQKDVGPDLGARRLRRRPLRRRCTPTRRSTSRRTWWPGCCSCCWRSRPSGWPTGYSLRAVRRQQASGAL